MKQILVIDSKKSVQLMLKTNLKQAGYDVTLARDGKTGRELFSVRPSDVVIVEILEPEMEGLKTIAGLKKDYPNVKIIATSEWTEGGFNPLLSAKSLGAHYTFSKPIHGKKLLSAMDELTSNHVSEALNSSLL